MECIDDYVITRGHFIDHFIVLLLSGYMSLHTGEDSHSSYLLDRVAEGLNYLEDNTDKPGAMTFELLRILHKTTSWGTGWVAVTLKASTLTT